MGVLASIGLAMIFQRLARDGQPFFEDNGRFRPRERVTLNRVAGVGELNPQPLFQIRRSGAGKGPGFLQFLEFTGQAFCVHNHKVSLYGLWFKACFGSTAAGPVAACCVWQAGLRVMLKD
ncbi:MAG: hypothetical protein HY053_07580 [Proteobacteria bacterium]|nr:hypothetical protein [Pseudomonadota bacterium]